MQEFQLAKHLFIGYYNWAEECGLTAHLIVNASTGANLTLPTHLLTDPLVLNISPTATSVLQIGDEGIWTNMRFSGVAHELFFSWDIIKAITTKEVPSLLGNAAYGKPVNLPKIEPALQSDTTKPRSHLTVVK